jgi:hypothetical protein
MILTRLDKRHDEGHFTPSIARATSLGYLPPAMTNTLFSPGFLSVVTVSADLYALYFTEAETALTDSRQAIKWSPTRASTGSPALHSGR